MDRRRILQQHHRDRSGAPQGSWRAHVQGPHPGIVQQRFKERRKESLRTVASQQNWAALDGFYQRLFNFLEFRSWREASLAPRSSFVNA
ncbi:hypothetical protein [Variovorax sp. HW608]|uniref:hypothetical protein n=1 Tax=Variovorax sp. HW608 TaxID=1034889 RepID=UPI00155F7045|nr:hypothetical protein [Variovorax sp. HW608]